MIDAGEVIKSCRLYKGWTQKQLALMSGVNRKTIGDLERNGTGPTLYTFETLLEAMGFELEIGLKEERLK
jgi:transcriptional regulator with XRE-family HTH domain